MTHEQIKVLQPGAALIGFISNEAYSDDEAADPASLAASLAVAQQRKIAPLGVQIELSDPGRLDAVR